MLSSKIQKQLTTKKKVLETTTDEIFDYLKVFRGLPEKDAMRPKESTDPFLNGKDLKNYGNQRAKFKRTNFFRLNLRSFFLRKVNSRMSQSASVITVMFHQICLAGKEVEGLKLEKHLNTCLEIRKKNKISIFK